MTTQYQVYISFSQVDEKLVTDLYNRLSAEKISVYPIPKWGDNVVSYIDKGIESAKFSLLVITKAYLRENRYNEIDALLDLDVNGKTKILPLWYNITSTDITSKYPIVAGKVALILNDSQEKTDGHQRIVSTLTSAVTEIKKVVNR